MPLRGAQAAAALALLVALPLQGQGAPPSVVPRLEAAFQRLRAWDDQHRLLQSRGVDRTPEGLTSAAVGDSVRHHAAQVRRLLDSLAPATAASPDHLAIEAILAALNGGLGAVPAPDSAAAPGGCDTTAAAAPTLARLTSAVLACYGQAAGQIVVGADTLNRLAVLGLLARVPDPVARRRLFLSLAPTWESVNRDNDPASPYRTLVRLRRAAWGEGASPIDAKGPAFGLAPDSLERWLEQALASWRRTLPDTLLEPWDWYHATGEASRVLGPAVPTIDAMLGVNHRFYRRIGADPDRLKVHYDLAARPGKYPVAFCDIGVRNHWDAAGRFVPGEPWVFASYLGGSFDNLLELLHETGHAIHVAAIRTRPAHLDWPDSDTFTEALADVPALEAFEPAWQWRFLGDSVPLATSIRAKYAGVVLDMAWALFEMRVHRTPGADPNATWAELTSTYLGIVPHPEWSWWAMRGQLIDSPGYLVNYALGAFIAADIRARIRETAGPDAWDRPGRYHDLAGQLYQFGLARPSREVLERFLGRPLRPQALFQDLARVAP